MLGFYTVTVCAGFNPVCTGEEIAPGEDGEGQADCDPGDEVTGGGSIQSEVVNDHPMEVSSSWAIDEDSWRVHFFHNGPAFDLGWTVFARCADLTP